jgi:serine/threonine-protein kinase HipA
VSLSAPTIHVYFTGRKKIVLVGSLALKNRQIFFEYSPEFIQTGLELSPFKLPLKSVIQINKDNVFDGLFGVFNDSLPDGWGRLLLDRKLRSLAINPDELSPLDRLRYVGKQGMGALIYLPESQGIPLLKYKNLDQIADEVYAFEEHDEDRFIDELLALNGSSAGARPKILIRLNREDWIIKFCSSMDPKDIGPIEYAYHLMAKKAQMRLPKAKLFSSKKGMGYFGVQRFDRKGSEAIHMHTLSGLIHADHRLPSVDYATIIKATAWLTKSANECEQQFRASVFNVLAHNRDDHAKNFSFLMSTEGKWSVSPAYDLTFSSGPSGEHCSMIMGEGKNPRMTHLLKLAELAGVEQKKAYAIIEEVRSAVSQWEKFAKQAGVTQISCNLIQKALDRIAKNG